MKKRSIRGTTAACTTLAVLWAIGCCGPAGTAGAAGIYMNHQNMTVELISPSSLTGGTLANVIDLDSPLETDSHSQASHVWVSGAPLELRFDFQAEYDPTTLHFWNYFSSGFDVDAIEFTFYDAADVSVGTRMVNPAVGVHPSMAEDFALSGLEDVRFVRAVLSGTNDEVDFQNMGFTVVPEPSSLLAAAAVAALMLGARPRRRVPRAGNTAHG